MPVWADPASAGGTADNSPGLRVLGIGGESAARVPYVRLNWVQSWSLAFRVRVGRTGFGAEGGGKDRDMARMPSPSAGKHSCDGRSERSSTRHVPDARGFYPQSGPRAPAFGVVGVDECPSARLWAG